MTDEQIALARRAVACKGWRWMPGMRYCSVAVAEGTASPLSFNGYQRVGEDVDMVAYTDWVPCLPYLTDPATLGCLLALVQEAHAVPFLQVSVKISREHGYQFDCHPHHRGQWVDSEAEALVVALEDAP